jgi:hypothetical protein
MDEKTSTICVRKVPEGLFVIFVSFSKKQNNMTFNASLMAVIRQLDKLRMLSRKLLNILRLENYAFFSEISNI